MGNCCSREGGTPIHDHRDGCVAEQHNTNTFDIQAHGTAAHGRQCVETCGATKAGQAGFCSTGRQSNEVDVNGTWLGTKATPWAGSGVPGASEAAAAAGQGSSKAGKADCLQQTSSSSSSGHSSSGSTSTSRHSTAPSCLTGCLSSRCLGRAPQATAMEGSGPAGTCTSGTPGTPSTSLHNRLLSLQSSGSLIPAFLLPAPSLQNDPSCGSSATTGTGLSAAPGASTKSSTRAKRARKQHPQHSSSSSAGSHGSKQKPNSGSNSHSSGDNGSSVLTATGLTLVVSSHSNSSHQGSPRAAPSGSSSRASSDSGDTAFASIPSSVCRSASASPDSMLSALSTASSCISTNSSSGCCSKGGRHPAAAAAAGPPAPAPSAALTAAAVSRGCTAAQQTSPAGSEAATQRQQQQQGLVLQPAASVQQLDLDMVDAEPAGTPPAQQQQQQYVTVQQGSGTAATASSPARQQPPQAAYSSPVPATRNDSEGSCSTPMQQTLHQQTPQTPQQQTPQQHALQQQQTPETPAPAAFWQASGWSFGSHSDQNARAYMEDRSVAIDLTGHTGLPPAERAGLFSVYDGHGGHQVAEFLADHVKAALLGAGPDALTAAPLRVLGEAVEDAERQLLLSYAEGDSTAAAGSTLCAVLLLDDKLHVAHVGDSRAVLARGSAAKQLTRDHKPACAIEARRIRSDDPEAEITNDGYLYSELAVARAIGSAHLKRDPSKRALIATAEVVTVQLERQDDFVLVATDGLWDAVSSSEAVSVARRVLAESRDAGAASRALVERAVRCGSSDNISVVTLLLHGRSILVPRSNSRLFKRPSSLSQSPAGGAGAGVGGAAVSGDGGSPLLA